MVYSNWKSTYTQYLPELSKLLINQVKVEKKNFFLIHLIKITIGIAVRNSISEEMYLVSEIDNWRV